MDDQNPIDPRAIIFLHLPKTAGQSVHHAIAGVHRREQVSPIRVNSQRAASGGFPPEYLFHSGHLDWLDLPQTNRFAFSIIRDPGERLGADYAYMRHKIAAQAGPESDMPHHRGITASPDRFFFPTDAQAAQAIRGRWANLTTTYFASRRLGGRNSLAGFSRAAIIDLAVAGTQALDAVYRFGDFIPLEDDIQRLRRTRPGIVDRLANPGPLPPQISRWQTLLDSFETDRARRLMQDFIAEDCALVDRVTFRSSQGPTGGSGQPGN